MIRTSICDISASKFIGRSRAGERADRAEEYVAYDQLSTAAVLSRHRVVYGQFRMSSLEPTHRLTYLVEWSQMSSQMLKKHIDTETLLGLLLRCCNLETVLYKFGHYVTLVQLAF